MKKSNDITMTNSISKGRQDKGQEKGGKHTLTSKANLLANMMAALRSRSESNTSMKVRFLCATQYMLRAAASPPPRAPHNCL